MLHTLACSLLLAAAAWPATPVAAEDLIEIPYEVEADGTVPFVDLSSVTELPIRTPSRTLQSLSNSREATTTNDDGSRHRSRSGSGSGTKATHTKSSSSVKCTATASSSSFSASRDAHANAVAVAVKKGCALGKLRPKWLKDVQYQFKEKAGYAIAAAWAEAATQCESSGNAAGCAKAKAVASAWAKATFSANAAAFALALNKCRHCNNKYDLAAAETYGFATEFEKVVIEVEAIAESKTCVSGDAVAGNQVFAECIHEVYATAFAKAAAKAIIHGQCGWYYGGKAKTLEADAYIKAEATIEKWEYITC